MTAVEIFLIIASMLGGLALFLFGMSTMSDSLSAMTGGALTRLLAKVTKNKLLAFLFGTALTALVQSASAVSVLTVGLVNSGIIELSKAIGLLIGANLGTTATAWILSLNAISGESLLLTIIKPSSFSPFLAIIGVLMTMFCHSDTKKNVGSALLGFSVMMIGMNMMSQAVAPLKGLPIVQKVLFSFANPILGFVVACLFAMLIQSSDAVIGIVQAFALAMGITFGMVIPLVCGAQVGTCITALLSSLGTSNNGKRTAFMNLYYNLLKTIPFLVIFYVLNGFFSFAFLDRNVGGIGIPAVHSLINLLGSLVWLPLSGVIVSLAKRTIPLNEEEKEEQANTLTMLDENLLGTPSVAIEQANRAVVLLSEVVGEAFEAVIGLREAPELSGQAQRLCGRAHSFHEQIDAYLMKISGREVGSRDRASLNLLHTANEAFGRMGKVAERILELAGKNVSSLDTLLPEERRDLKILGEAFHEIIQLSTSEFKVRSKTLSQTIQYYREEIMELSGIIKKRYIQRLHQEGEERENSTLYPDICYMEEQLIDDCDMIADALIRFDAVTGKSRPVSQGESERSRQQIHELFRDKFEAMEETITGTASD